MNYRIFIDGLMTLSEPVSQNEYEVVKKCFPDGKESVDDTNTITALTLYDIGDMTTFVKLDDILKTLRK